jgi:hypothetical protein
MFLNGILILHIHKPPLTEEEMIHFSGALSPLGMRLFMDSDAFACDGSTPLQETRFLREATRDPTIPDARTPPENASIQGLG